MFQGKVQLGICSLMVQPPQRREREASLVGNLNIPMLNGLFSCVQALVLYPWISFALSSGPMPLAKGLVGVWYSWALA